MNRQITWQDFYLLQRFGMTPNLDNIQRFCDRLDRPEKSFPSIHVGGTNGKGSVAALLDAILRAAKMRVGLYTSPHILRFNERIQVGGEMISDEDVFAFWDAHWDFIQEYRCTFFEVATAMGLDYFRRSGVEVAIVEVGLGGTYDATRVVDSALAVLTRIDYDHTDRLGNTLEQIAADKAGIFRPNHPALSGNQHPEVMRVLRKRAFEIGSDLFLSSDVVTLQSPRFTRNFISAHAVLKSPAGNMELPRWKCPLVGHFQRENIETALGAIALLPPILPSVNSEAIVLGISSVQWPGRLQQLRKNPYLIVDVGHNPGAIAATTREIMRLWKPGRLLTIFSAMRDKDVLTMMSILKGVSSQAFVTPLPRPRGLSLEEISSLACQAGWNATPMLSVSKALQAAFRDAQKEDVILATGSHLLVEEVLKSKEFA